MDIYNFHKMMSNPVKAQLVVHFVTCMCHNCSVADLTKKLDAKQANISKHLANLRAKKVLSCVRKQHQVFYFVNKSWLNRYNSLMKILITERAYQNYVCKCNAGNLAV